MNGLLCALAWLRWKNWSSLCGPTLGQKFSKLWTKWTSSPGLRSVKQLPRRLLPWRSPSWRAAALHLPRTSANPVVAAAAAAEAEQAEREAQRRALAAPPAASPAVPRTTLRSLMRTRSEGTVLSHPPRSSCGASIGSYLRRFGAPFPPRAPGSLVCVAPPAPCRRFPTTWLDDVFISAPQGLTGPRGSAPRNALPHFCAFFGPSGP
mmetsp:Transcript_22117/g.59671  ORF Transcript_22117/g.59671 Transcript_22117/m.59671 type:complete len:207 (-) Transcript_22117:88-708(-)